MLSPVRLAIGDCYCSSDFKNKAYRNSGFVGMHEFDDYKIIIGKTPKAVEYVQLKANQYPSGS